MELVKSINISRLKQDSHSRTRLYKLLEQLDDFYVPKISSQVNLSEYCDKIIAKADVFIADIAQKDAGLLAMYLNNFSSKSAFITSIGVLPEFREYKLGQYLIDLAIAQTLAKNFNSIQLEVGIQNIRAIRFYEKNKFVATHNQGSSLYMLLNI